MGKRIYSPDFKSNIVLLVISQKKDVHELAKEYNISPNLILNWRKEFYENSSKIFEKKNNHKNLEKENLELKNTNEKLLLKLDIMKKIISDNIGLECRKDLFKQLKNDNQMRLITTKEFADMLKVNRTSIYYNYSKKNQI